MSDLFRLAGSYDTSPQTGAQASGDPQVCATLDERVTVANKTQINIVLDTDDVHVVPLGGLTAAHIVIMRTIGGKAKARFTSTDGTTQAIPVDPFFCLISGTVPITAIDLTRVAGIPTTVKVFMAEKPV